LKCPLYLYIEQNFVALTPLFRPYIKNRVCQRMVCQENLTEFSQDPFTKSLLLKTLLTVIDEYESKKVCSYNRPHRRF
jgi:hypothetical protein